MSEETYLAHPDTIEQIEKSQDFALHKIVLSSPVPQMKPCMAIERGKMVLLKDFCGSMEATDA